MKKIYPTFVESENLTVSWCVGFQRDFSFPFKKDWRNNFFRQIHLPLFCFLKTYCAISILPGLLFRSSLPEVFYEKAVVKIFAILTRKHRKYFLDLKLYDLYSKQVIIEILVAPITIDVTVNLWKSKCSVSIVFLSYFGLFVRDICIPEFSGLLCQTFDII